MYDIQFGDVGTDLSLLDRLTFHCLWGCLVASGFPLAFMFSNLTELFVGNNLMMVEKDAHKLELV